MSQQLDTLILEMSTLTGIVSGELNRIDAALDTAAERVGDTYREFYVNQVSGDDTASGSLAHPLASLTQAMVRSVWGGITIVRLQGDYEMRTRFTLKTSSFVVLGDAVGGSAFTLAVPVVGGTVPQFVVNRENNADAGVTMKDIRLRLPTHGTSEPLFANTGPLRIALRSVAITLDAGAVRPLTGGTGALGLILYGTTYPTEMSGKWVESVAAGEEATTARRVAYSSIQYL